MITENVPILKIHKLTQAQYDREHEAGRLDATALYLTPDDTSDSQNVYVQDTEPTEAVVGDVWFDTSSGTATEAQPLSILQGGTGANTAEEARANLEAAPAFSSGATILTSFQYGDTLPEEATLGRVFFKKA